ncbi:MAG: amidase family protein, partial [Burkholderiales bacterium]
MKKNDLCSLSATQLLQLYRRKEASPVEATRAVLERIAELNPVLNAFCFLDPDASIKTAKESEKRWRKGQPRGLL